MWLLVLNTCACRSGSREGALDLEKGCLRKRHKTLSLGKGFGGKNVFCFEFVDFSLK